MKTEQPSKSHIETKHFCIKMSAVDDVKSGGLQWTGYVSAYGNVDSYKDIVQKGAFASAVGLTYPAFYEHYIHVGKLRVLEEDAYGLKVFGELMPDDIQSDSVGKLSEKLRWMMRESDAGALAYKMSIGYRVKRAHYETIDGEEVRMLTDLELVEGSLLLNPANDKAVVTGWKSGDLITLDAISEMTERDLERALRSGSKMSASAAKMLVSAVRAGAKNEAVADAIGLKSIAETISAILNSPTRTGRDGC